VTVQGFRPGAKIEVSADGVVVGSEESNTPWGVTIEVSPALSAGQIVTATQTFDGFTSGPSEPVVVRNVSEVYPGGLPKPNLPATPLYQCGIATFVNQLPPGGEVRVFAEPPGGGTPDIVSQRSGVAVGQSLGVSPPFETNQRVTAESQICSLVSPPSDEEMVQPAPTSLPVPVVADLWDGGSVVVLGDLVNGTRVRITNGGTPIGGGGAPSGSVWFPVDPPVSDGDPIEATQSLCDVTSLPGTTIVGSCADLPPARLRAPRAGDTEVELLDFEPGSRILVFASGEEVGDGGGPRIALTRPLAEGEEVIVVQIQGDCVSSTSHAIDVGTGLEDPAEPGLCSVERFEYGAAGSPDIRTTDVSEYFSSPEAGVAVPMNAVPLHGIVRYPTGIGPFPLILIVHGNHSPFDPSEPGYGYLLDLWANHCMIAVSVDENFLNGNVSGEMDARAIVLLRHLQLWREWNQTIGHQFFTKVDLDKVGLAGHSRGGEAITVAKEYNTLKHDSSDPDHDFGFGIRGLYAIAPVDGQIDDVFVTGVVRGADYFVMHGSHDGDVSRFNGHRAYDRAHGLTTPGTRFKGLLYVYGANHGQWNTGWGTTSEHTVNPVANRISGADQRSIGEVYTTAFFLSSLRGFDEYNTLFKGDVTFASLSATVTRVTQYQDPIRVYLNHYEEDDNLATGSFPGVTNGTVPTLDPYEDRFFQDQDPPSWTWEQTDGPFVGWEGSTSTQIVISLPAEAREDLALYPYLALRVGQVYELEPSRNSPGVDKDFTIQVMFGSTPSPDVRVSTITRLPYPDETDHPTRGNQTKTIMQTVRIPWASLLEDLEPGLLSELSEIHLKFDRHEAGLLILDEIQFTR
jgi:hypothetical protein